MSENLAKALENVVDTVSRTGRYLWVDQICINQQDLGERSSQVRYMNYVYQQAATVCVWLGESGDDHDVALDILRSWKSTLTDIAPSGKPLLSVLTQIPLDSKVWPELIASISSEEKWAAVDKLSRRAWWGRAWVVQEATGPVNTYIMCGKCSLPFSDVIKALMIGRLITQMPGYSYQPLYSRWSYCMLMISELRKYQQLQLLDALQFVRAFACANPRDKVYAILGLIQNNNDIVIPDYDRSVIQVYTDVVRYCITAYPELHRLDFLGHVSTSSPLENAQRCPSFVPNWNELTDVDNFKKTTVEYNITDRLYRASLDHTGYVSLDGDTLFLDAFAVDVVTDIGNVCESEEDMLATLDSWRLQNPRDTYVDGTCTEEEAYLHTIVGDVLRKPGMLVRGAKFIARLLSNENFTQTASVAEAQETHIMRVSVRCNVLHRRIFRTKAGYMGIGPSSMDLGDEIYGFLGGQMLYVVQRLNEAMQQNPDKEVLGRTFVGECYIHGLMDGQALCYSDDGSVQSDRMFLR